MSDKIVVNDQFGRTDVPKTKIYLLDENTLSLLGSYDSDLPCTASNLLDNVSGTNLFVGRQYVSNKTGCFVFSPQNRFIRITFDRLLAGITDSSQKMQIIEKFKPSLKPEFSNKKKHIFNFGKSEVQTAGIFSYPEHPIVVPDLATPSAANELRFSSFGEACGPRDASWCILPIREKESSKLAQIDKEGIEHKKLEIGKGEFHILGYDNTSDLLLLLKENAVDLLVVNASTLEVKSQVTFPEKISQLAFRRTIKVGDITYALLGPFILGVENRKIAKLPRCLPASGFGSRVFDDIAHKRIYYSTFNPDIEKEFMSVSLFDLNTMKISKDTELPGPYPKDPTDTSPGKLNCVQILCSLPGGKIMAVAGSGCEYFDHDHASDGSDLSPGSNHSD